ncbi:NAD-dependent DNA ligase LigA, partial [Candidatus Similichlamydia epinepheli]|uniref:NAD-dependent DNA ligase LigA n=1 Tax=Candidatus Similichlamydia epinepheli TaxID=1903953 RepID=UPI000D3A1DA7
QKVETERESLPFRIDGIVVKLDRREDQMQMGTTGQYYKWGVAFKYQACRVRTQIRSIFSQVGRSGAVTPVACLEPVYLDGSCVSKATLHNFGWAFEKEVREGDFVWICKGGDIIPQIIEVDLTLRPNGTLPLQLPKTCNSCDSILEGCPMTLRCTNPFCRDKSIQSLIHFVDALSIDGLGKRTIEELVKRNIVKDWDDLFRLDSKSLEDLPHSGPVLAKKIIESIEKSKNVPFFSFLYAIGIPYIGKRNARALAKKCDSWDALRVLSVEDLQSIHGFGEKVARSTYEALRDLEPRVRSLFALGVSTFSEKKGKDDSSLFFGLSFVITGTFKSASRKEIEKIIIEQGGSVLSSISQKTDYLLIGESPGSKLKQAQSFNNITIVNEAWLFSNLEKVYQNVS